MRINKMLLIGIVGVSLLSGCTHTVTSYSPSFDNLNRLQAIKKSQQKIALSSFTATVPNQRSIMCRLEGTETLPNNQTYEEYIQDALHSELASAGLLSDASKVVLNANLDKVDFNSMTGHWIIQMTFNSNVGQPFTVKSSSGFAADFVADMACEEVAKAFVPAVQQFLDKLYADPDFKRLLSYRKS
jgi:hypothetical protein